MADWTDAQVEQARKYFVEGQTCSAIAKQLGRSRNAVIGKLSRIGITAADRVREPRDRRLGGIAERMLVNNAKAKRKKAAAIAELAAAERTGGADFDCARFACKPAPGYPGKPLLELRPSQCRYPLDPIDGGPLLFCAAPAMDVGLSWCAYHFRICYRPEPPAPIRPLWR
jgi:GcrA cell cycle regulator